VVFTALQQDEVAAQMPMSTPISQAPDFQSCLASAIAQQAIQACFQPIVDAQSRRVVGCELLPCWHDESHGRVLARTIIAFAQRLGLLEVMALQVWARSLVALHGWRSSGKNLTLLVNVSCQQFHAHGFMVQLVNDLSRLDIALSCIDLEIAESVAMEDGRATARRIAELRKAGFGIVIGDIGSGHSTFSQLLGLSATGIRIDAALTRRVQGQVGAQLVEAIVKLAQVSHLNTIAAGVEDAETAATLTLLGVHCLQGRFFGEPVDSQSFGNMLTQDDHAP